MQHELHDARVGGLEDSPEIRAADVADGIDELGLVEQIEKLGPELEALTFRGLSRSSKGLAAGDVLRARNLHLAELAYADHQFGVLLDQLALLSLMESTLIIGVADHGELFGEHGRMSHSGKRVDELVHVPLFIRFPDDAGAPSGSIIDVRVDLRDVKPTLLDYLGIDDDSSRGRSLLPLIRHEVSELPPAAATPGRRGDDGDNLIECQDPETNERLKARLRELGYIE